VLSSAFGMDRPADLGAAKPDVAAYDAFVRKHGLVHTSPDADYTLASKHTFAGSYALDEVIPEGVILATRTLRGNAPSIHDVTVRFHDGSAEAAAFVDLSPYGYPLAGPVRAAFRIAVTGPRSVQVSIDSIQFGRIGVPGDILARAQDGVNAYLATRLAGSTGSRSRRWLSRRAACASRERCPRRTVERHRRPATCPDARAIAGPTGHGERPVAGRRQGDQASGSR